MQYKFSPSKNGFFLVELHGEAVPSDAIDLTAQEHAELLAGQAQGKRIVVGADGRPELADPVLLSPAQLAAKRMAEIKAGLSQIDADSARPAREIAIALAGGAVPTAAAVTKVTTLEATAQALRAELASLVGVV